MFVSVLDFLVLGLYSPHVGITDLDHSSWMVYIPLSTTLVVWVVQIILVMRGTCNCDSRLDIASADDERSSSLCDVWTRHQNLGRSVSDLLGPGFCGHCPNRSLSCLRLPMLGLRHFTDSSSCDGRVVRSLCRVSPQNEIVMHSLGSLRWVSRHSFSVLLLYVIIETSLFWGGSEESPLCTLSCEMVFGLTHLSFVSLHCYRASTIGEAYQDGPSTSSHSILSCTKFESASSWSIRFVSKELFSATERPRTEMFQLANLCYFVGGNLIAPCIRDCR